MSMQNTVDQLWDAPHPGTPVNGTVVVPASKSLTNRYLLLAALADGTSRIRNALASRDSDLMIAALRATRRGHRGAAAARRHDRPAGHPAGPGRRSRPAREAAPENVAIDCGLAGTVMRFVPPLAALVRGEFSFDGDPHARLRPMAPIVAALKDLGVQVAEHGADGMLPFTVTGTGTPCRRVASWSTAPAPPSSSARCC